VAHATTANRVDRRTRTARAEGGNGRDALLEAATKIFARRGFRDASMAEIAREAGFSKGGVYWHFSGKDDLFMALLEERVDLPVREMIELLESAPPEQNLAPEASSRFVDALRGQRELLLLDREYWSQAVRDPKLRARYAKRQAELRSALGRALEARMRHLGTPGLDRPEKMATIAMALAAGLAQEKLIDPDVVPDDLLGEALALIYAGLVARAQALPSR
jgi:AcrR family transcriptional regulator